MTEQAVPLLDVMEGASSQECRENELLELDLLEEERREECLAVVVAYLANQAETASKAGVSYTKESCGSRGKSHFFNRCTPRISLHDYVHRIAKFTSASSVCFVMACAYIERMSQADERCQVSQRTVHRLLLCGVLLAAKLTDDKFRSNSYFSKVGGVSKAAVNEMEVSMFKMLNYSLCLSQQKIAAQLHKMVQSVNENRRDTRNDQESRRGKKRLIEDVPAELENDIPSKLQHDDQHNEILITKAKESRGRALDETENMSTPCGDQAHEDDNTRGISDLLSQASCLLHKPDQGISDDSDYEELASMQSLGLSNSFTSCQSVDPQESIHSHDESDLDESSSLTIPGLSDSCAKAFCHFDRQVSSGINELQECK